MGLLRSGKEHICFKFEKCDVILIFILPKFELERHVVFSRDRRQRAQPLEIRRPPGPACGEALRNVAVGNGAERKLRKQFWGAGGWGFQVPK